MFSLFSLSIITVNFVTSIKNLSAHASPSAHDQSFTNTHWLSFSQKLLQIDSLILRMYLTKYSLGLVSML